MTPLLKTVRRWYCPNCRKEDTTTDARPHSRFHVCPKLGNLTAPMVPAGTSAKVTAHEREDYVGSERVTLDANGRPVMSIVTERSHGQDVAVFAPMAGDARALIDQPIRFDPRTEAQSRVRSAERAVSKARAHVAAAATDITRAKEQAALRGAETALAQATAELKGLH